MLYSDGSAVFLRKLKMHSPKLTLPKEIGGSIERQGFNPDCLL